MCERLQEYGEYKCGISHFLGDERTQGRDKSACPHRVTRVTRKHWGFLQKINSEEEPFLNPFSPCKRETLFLTDGWCQEFKLWHRLDRESAGRYRWELLEDGDGRTGPQSFRAQGWCSTLRRGGGRGEQRGCSHRDVLTSDSHEPGCCEHSCADRFLSGHRVLTPSGDFWITK